MQLETKDQFVTCACGSSDHIMRLRSFCHFNSEGNPSSLSMFVELILNPNRSLANRIISAVKYIFCYKNESYEFDDIVLDDENVEKLVNFLQDYQNKKKMLR